MGGIRSAAILALSVGLGLLPAAPCGAEEDTWARVGRVNHVAATTIAVSNLKVSPRDGRSAVITFDIAWDGSWRTAANHDAAWVFFKALPRGANTWEHVTLESSGVNPPAFEGGRGMALELEVPAERTGLFVRRAKEGAGALAAQSVTVVWRFVNGPIRPDAVRVMAQAVEMVYVPEGPNTVGSGAREASDFRAGGPGSAPFAITSESALPIADAKGSLYYRANPGRAGDAAGPIPAAYPKGFAAFYCMKYELTEGQWVDFFNTLAEAQKVARDITSAGNGGKNTDDPVKTGNNPRAWWWIFRNTVSWTGGEAASQERDLACNHLSWADGAAWADWAGLRPMTELEYEKARRAPQATPPAWGIMYLDASLGERAVTVGDEAGRSFTGLHGDGSLDASGEANVPAWPGADAKGAGLRGGYGPPFNPHSAASDRGHAALVETKRHYGFGWRGVRSAPAQTTP